MKAQLFRYLLLITCMNALSLPSFAKRTATPIQTKGVYIYNFTKVIEWENEAALDQFIIGLYGSSDELYQELVANVQGKVVRNKKIEIRTYSELSLAKDAQIIFVSESENKQIREISHELSRSNTLLVTYNCGRPEWTMINFTRPHENKISFEINKPNIAYERLKISKEILALGGTELDVAILYKETEAALQQSKQQIEEQQKQVKNQAGQITMQDQRIQEQINQMAKQNIALENQEAKFFQQQREIESHLTELQYQQELIRKQNNHIQQQSNEVELKKDELKRLEGNYTRMKTLMADYDIRVINLETDLEKKEGEIADKEANILTLANKIVKKKQVLEVQENQIQSQLAQILQQKTTMKGQWATIRTQKTLLIIISAMFCLVVVLIVIAFRGYTQKKKTNERLYAKNLELEKTMTILQKTQEELKIAKRQAEAANEAKSHFLANMSHEIRTPMNAILGFTEILSETVTGSDQKTFLRYIQSSSKTLLRLINDILDLSKIEAGKLQLEYKPVDICAVIREVQQIFAQKVLEKGNEFRLDLNKELPEHLLLDELRIRQILLNVVGNSIKFTESGWIQIRAFPVNDNGDRIDMKLEIEDSGIGIPKIQLEKIFGTFEQQDEQRFSQYGGTGLGLAITKKLIGIMGGEICCRSEMGKGSKFIIHLPNVSIAHDSICEEEIAFDYESIQLSEATILVVDDKAENRRMVKEYLRPYDITVLEAKDGNEAVESTQTCQPDLVLMDIVMANVDGNVATKTIKSIDEIKHIPIVAFTAAGMKQDEERAAKIYDGYLRKPVSKSDLISELTRFLEFSTIETEGKEKWTDEKIEKGSISQKLENDENCEELLRDLKRSIVTASNLIKPLSINKVENFGKQMEQLGDRYELRELSKWGIKLSNEAGLFKIEELSQSLKEYPRLVEKVKTQVQVKMGEEISLGQDRCELENQYKIPLADKS